MFDVEYDSSGLMISFNSILFPRYVFMSMHTCIFFLYSESPLIKCGVTYRFQQARQVVFDIVHWEVHLITPYTVD
jgi:hypothetical protein